MAHWQNLVAVLLVLAAAWHVAMRLRRTIAGKGGTACHCADCPGMGQGKECKLQISNCKFEIVAPFTVPP